jgi:hypothetical protein
MGFRLPNCFFFFRVKSKGIREWDMGIHYLIASFSLG